MDLENNTIHCSTFVQHTYIKLNPVGPIGAGRLPETRSVEEAQQYPTGWKFWLTILTMSALVVLGGLDTNIVATAVPRYELQS